MARGRKPKQTDSKILEHFELKKNILVESLYKDLAKIRYQVDLALTYVGQIDSVDSLAEASFKAGRAYGPLDEANDKLEEILDNIHNNNEDFEYWNNF